MSPRRSLPPSPPPPPRPQDQSGSQSDVPLDSSSKSLSLLGNGASLRSTYEPPSATSSKGAGDHDEQEGEDTNAEAGPSTVRRSYDNMDYRHRGHSPVQIPPLAIDIDTNDTAHTHWGAYGSTSNIRGEGSSQRQYQGQVGNGGGGTYWRREEERVRLPAVTAGSGPYGKSKRDMRHDTWLDQYPGHAITREVEQLQSNLGELTSLMRPFAKSVENPSPAKPPTHLQARFIRLSMQVGESLNRIAPHVSPYLSAEFTIPPPGRAVALTAAEEAMENIRKRRDVLIAKAAQLANSDRGSYAPQYTNGNGNGNGNGYGHGDGKQYAIWPSPLTDHRAIPSNFQEGGYDEYPQRQGDVPMILEPPQHWGGTCHSCGVGLGGDGLSGPDGPMSLCHLCGSHYARLSMRRTQSAEGRIALGAHATAI